MNDKAKTQDQADQQPAHIPSPGFPSTVPPELSAFTTPLSLRGWPTWLVYALAILGGIYLLNPTFGMFELLPDNLPIVGNLDEGIAVILVWLGVVEYFAGRKKNPPETGSEEK